MELSQCGAGGLLKARATMRVSRLRPRRSERSTVVVVAVAVGALVTLVLLPLPGRGIELHRRGSVGIYHRSSGIDGSIMVITRPYVGWRSVFTDCVSAAPPREVYRVFPPEIDISDSVRRQRRGPRPEFTVRRSVPPHGPATRCGLRASRTSK